MHWTRKNSENTKNVRIEIATRRDRTVRIEDANTCRAMQLSRGNNWIEARKRLKKRRKRSGCMYVKMIDAPILSQDIGFALCRVDLAHYTRVCV